MAAPTYVTAGTGVIIQTGSASVSISSISSGDLIILQIEQDGSAASAVTLSSPVTLNDITGSAGMTIMVVGGQASLQRHHIYVGRSTSTSCSITVATSGDDLYCRMYAFNAANTGTTLASVFEAGGFVTVESQGTVAQVDDAGFATNGADRLALQLVAINDDNAMGDFTGETGGDWVEAVAEFASATGTDACIQLQTATIPTATTIDGGSFTMAAADSWDVIGTAIIPVSGAAPAEIPSLVTARRAY